MAPRSSGSFLLMTIECLPLLNGLLITSVCKRHFWEDYRAHVAAKAPEYALDEVLSTASDMYSLGCLIYAVHLKGDPPFKNFGNLASVREQAGRPLSGIGRLDRDLQGISLFVCPYVCSKCPLQQCSPRWLPGIRRTGRHPLHFRHFPSFRLCQSRL
jgi:serine/threonine protein kinase